MSYPIKKLGEICDFQGGSQPAKSEFIFEPKTGYIRFLQIRDFSSDKNITYIPNSTKNRICENDDILIGRYGASVGKILTGKKGAYNVAIIKTFPNFDFLDKRYFYFYLISNNFQSPLLNACSRAAQDGFSKKDIENFPVLLPPLPTQKLIVQKLDSSFEKIDKSIELTKKNLENIEKLNKSVLEEIYGKSEYKEIQIGKIITFNYGKGVDKSDKSENGLYDVYGANGVMYKSNKFLFDGESIIVGRKGSAGALKRVSGKFWASDVTYFVTVNGKDNLDYIYNGLKYLNIPSLAQGVKPGINRNHVYELKIPLPPLEKQKEIVLHLDQVFEKNRVLKESYEKKLKDLEEMKQSLLKEAFEGRLVKE